jgi:Flp pilus assembly protein TadG
MSIRRPRGSYERGNTLGEFAVVLAAILSLIFGIVDFGRVMYIYHLIGNAARAGTRYAIVRGSACTAPGCPASASDIQTYVRSLTPEINQSAVAVATNWSTSGGCGGAPFTGPGCLVTVQVTYNVRLIAVPLLPGITMPISSTSQMVISQ